MSYLLGGWLDIKEEVKDGEDDMDDREDQSPYENAI